MKRTILNIVAVAVVAAVGTSCMTTYDAYGRPVQSVDPGMATAGVAAAGLAGYAIGKNNGKKNYYYNDNHYGHGPRPRPYYGGGGYGYRGGYYR